MKGVFVLKFLFLIQVIVECRIETRHKLNRDGIIVKEPRKHFDSVSELALENCQEAFKWEKWNCPSHYFYAKATNSVNNTDREQAFVTALMAASKLYNDFVECTKKSSTECDILIGDDERHDDRYTRDLESFAGRHNIKVGEIAVKNSIKYSCRCHGMSGSCSLQTCWKTLNEFSKITSVIKRMYDNSIKVQLDNFGRIDMDKTSHNRLVFVNESPNYCITTASWKGTKNRKCSKGSHPGATESEKFSCKNLCKSCGLSVMKHKIRLQEKCNFKFDWKTGITFDICDEMVNEYFCD